MQLFQAIDWFIDYMKFIKNRSPKTIENYVHRLGRFLEYVGDIDTSYVTLSHINNYRLQLSKSGLSIKTINFHLIALRSFSKYCLKNDIDMVLADKIELPKLTPRTVNRLTQEEVDKLLQAPLSHYNKNKKDDIDDLKEDMKIVRDLAILHILYGSWLRVSEVCNLKHKNIKLDSNQFWVIGKGNKLRAVFLSKSAMQYIQQRILLKGNTHDDNFVFTNINKQGNIWQNPLHRNSIEALVRDYARSVGIDKKVTPHTLRHSFATTLIKKWADIRSIQQLLWHSSIMTTQIYTHVDDKYLSKVHDLIDE